MIADLMSLILRGKKEGDKIQIILSGKLHIIFNADSSGRQCDVRTIQEPRVFLDKEVATRSVIGVDVEFARNLTIEFLFQVPYVCLNPSRYKQFYSSVYRDQPSLDHCFLLRPNGEFFRDK